MKQLLISEIIMTIPKSNKNTFKAKNFNLHIFHENMMYENNYGLMLGPTTGYAYPPISREELKELADFIYKILDIK